jgi:hypothetical protein
VQEPVGAAHGYTDASGKEEGLREKNIFSLYFTFTGSVGWEATWLLTHVFKDDIYGIY